MSQLQEASTLIVGVGSAHGDDRIGWIVCDRLAGELKTAGSENDIEVVKLKSPIELMNWLPEERSAKAPRRLIICDACSGLGGVGEVAHWQWPSTVFGDLHWSGTHDFSVLQTLTLADTLGRLPQSVDIWGIEKGDGPRSLGENEFCDAITHGIQQATTQIHHSTLLANQNR